MTTGDPGHDPETGQRYDRPLPEPVRQRVLALASEALGGLEADAIPGALRPFARFTPAKRARLAAGPLAAALEAEPDFRRRVAALWREREPQLSAALEAGEVPPAADPADVATAAYLVRPPGWPGVVAVAVDAFDAVERATATARAGEAADRLREQLAASRAAARDEVARYRTEADEARRAADGLRRQLKEVREQARRAEQETRRVREGATELREAAEKATTAMESELRRVRRRLAEAEDALEAARRAAREDRALGDTRLRLLLDTVVEAAQGLRRELALPPVTARPADTVSAVVPAPFGPSDVAERALAADDPALLDQLLRLPQVHLVVDGYNVTKSGYGTLPLEAQRARLLSGLAALAAQCRAEVTCVFDGADLRAPVPMVMPRRVRVLFSPQGQTADELVRRIVRAEPAGRPVVVVSSDREVADGVRQAGARPVPATLLLHRLERI